MPDTWNANALPGPHPARFTTACTSADRSGVRWPSAAWPTVAQSGGDQGTKALVVARPVTAFTVLV